MLSFAGTFAVIVGIGMQTPLVTKLLMDGVTPLSSRLGGVLGRMAPRSVVSSLSRTAIAIAALMIAVSVTIGVSLMVSSFRYTVVAWLAQTVQGDVYISPPSATATANTATIDPAADAIVRGWPGVARVDTLRSVTVDSPDGPVQLAAVDNPGLGDERIFLAADGTPDEVWAAMQAGAVIVSEPYANRVGLPRRGGEVTLLTEQGERTFPVAGIYYDYASSQGTVMLALPLYRDLWQDTATTALALRLAEGADPDQITQELQDALAPVQSLQVRPNQALRDEALVIFDRTFAITGALQLLATLVAFIGVLERAAVADAGQAARAGHSARRGADRPAALAAGGAGDGADGRGGRPAGHAHRLGAGPDPDLHHQPAQLRLDLADAARAGAVYPGVARGRGGRAAGRHLPGLPHDADGRVRRDEVRVKREVSNYGLDGLLDDTDGGASYGRPCAFRLREIQ